MGRDGRFGLESAEPGTYTLRRGWVFRDPHRGGAKTGGASGQAQARVLVTEGVTASVRLG